MVLRCYSVTNIIKRTGYLYLVASLVFYALVLNVFSAQALSLDAAYENATGYETVGWCGGGKADYRTYCRRNCTSYVAYKLAAAGVSAVHYMNNGNGADWYTRAKAKGIATGTTPKVGAVAYWNATSANMYGHVGWVDSVNPDGSVNTSNYNGFTGEFYRQTSARPSGYIYFSNTLSIGSVGTASYIGTNTLTSGVILKPNQYILSSDVRSVLMLQKDGNLVLYQNGYKASWHSNTAGQPISKLAMQSDGNLVLYRTDGKVAWHSKTNGNIGARLSLQSDGNLVMYSTSSSPLWSTGTVLTSSASYVSSDRILTSKTLYRNQYIRSSDKRYAFVFQSDGNLVVISPGGKPLWNSGTSGKGGVRLIVQPDGNLVMYNGAGTAVWNISKFASGAYLVQQGDGNLVMYNSSGRAYWNSGTSGKI